MKMMHMKYQRWGVIPMLVTTPALTLGAAPWRRAMSMSQYSHPTLCHWWVHIRMNWWNSPRCEFYRSVRNAVKLTKCWEILWSEPFRGLLWPNLWSEAGHIWARTTFPFICCAAGIGLHNCRHYNWLACVQPGLSAQKVNTTVKNNQSVIDASLHIIRNLSS